MEARCKDQIPTSIANLHQIQVENLNRTYNNNEIQSW